MKKDLCEIDVAALLREKDREIERLKKELQAEKDKNFMLNNKLLQLERKPEANHLSYHTANKISHPIKKIATKPVKAHKGNSVSGVRKGKYQTESMLKNVIVEKRLQAFAKGNDDDAPVNNRINVLRDSRIPDDATYEELLYLEKKIGDVSKGLTKNELDRLNKEFYRNNYQRRFGVSQEVVISAIVGEDFLLHELFREKKQQKDYYTKMKALQIGNPWENPYFKANADKNSLFTTNIDLYKDEE